MVKTSFPARILAALLLLAVLIFPCAPAQAASFSSLSRLQQYLENHSPAQNLAAGSISVELTGTIESITWTGPNNHYDMILLVEDSAAIPPSGSDSPQLHVHFRLHKEEPPFKVGETVTVSGSLNALYSSVVIPWILADTFNGSDDF